MPSLPFAKLRLPALSAIAVLALLSGCNNARVTTLTATTSANATPVRAGAGLKLEGQVEINGTVKPASFVLKRTRPEAAAVTRPPTAVGSGSVRAYTLEVPAGDAAIVLEQGSKWTARLDVPFIYLGTERRGTKEVRFDVHEPLGTFGFIDAPAPFEWRVRGYLLNDGGNNIGPLTSEFFAEDNFPIAREGDRAFGFRIQPVQRNWTDEFWSAEFISPPLHANTTPGWHLVRRYRVHTRTNAAGLQIQPIISIMDSTGNLRTFQAGFRNMNGDDAWQAHDVDFTVLDPANPNIQVQHVMTISFRVFGRGHRMDNEAGKKVMIDEIVRLP